MTVSLADLEKIAVLAHLNHDAASSEPLREEIEAIMNFVDQMRTVNTDGVEPLCHPFAHRQPLRLDTVSEASCLAELEAIAPVFEDSLYLVPKVIDAEETL